MSKNKFKIVFLICFCIFGASAQSKKTTTKPAAKPATKTAVKPAASSNSEGIFAEFETTKGKITVQLDYKKAPITVANFISLAEGTNTFVTDPGLKGKHYFDGLKFHRVISKSNGDAEDFMIQGGDPMGTGMGGPGYAFKNENTEAKFDKAGILAMANSGPNTNGSQFFITIKETPWLSGSYSVFGYLTEGQNIVNTTKKDDVMNKVSIIRKGVEAKKFDAPKVFADYMNNKDAEAKKLAEEKEKSRAEVVAKQFPGAQKTASGIYYTVIKEGTGNMPTANSKVKVHYTGTFVDGKVFDSSVQRGEPIDFPLNGVIRGWTEGLQLMKEGAKYKFYIPSNLAYGERGAGGVIPPNTDLIFEVELLKIME